MEDYKRKASVLVQNCHDLLQSGNWQIENIMPNGDIIFYMDRPKPEGKILKIVVRFGIPRNSIFVLTLN